ncbi:MAG: flagellar motor switch protein FliG [Desulfobulbaceae bacterium]|jgi:flagellar motor switch protein FliG|nr:flagellar motor switch protein FliG [Desulfobulbaceae bacterium]
MAAAGDNLSGVNRAAILLICLGEEATARIFSELSDDEIRRVTRAMAVIEHIPQQSKEKVIEQFRRSQANYSGMFVKGKDFAKKSLQSIPTPERGRYLLDQFVSNDESKNLETIAMMQPRMVAGLLEKEHPQTIALVLATQEVSHAAEILSQLPEATRPDIVNRIAKIEKVSPDVLGRIEDAIQREIGLVAGREERQVGGIDRVVEILGGMKNNLDTDILEKLEETEPELTEDIRKKMFTFEDLVSLDGRSLQLILREVNNDSLTLALKTASDEMKDKIFANMSARASEMIKDDLEAMGPVRLSEVETMQQTIVKIAMKLEEEGKLVLGGGGGDELV